LVFEPTGATLESLVGNHDALRLPIQIEIARRRPLTTRMWENLFREMEQAALATDLRLYEQAVPNAGVRDQEGFRLLLKQTDRFVVTSVNRGSIEITAAILLAAGWVYKTFIEPGWEKSQTKQHWDVTVAGMIDTAVPILKENINAHVIERLQRLQIRRVSVRPPSDRPLSLSSNTNQGADLVYAKPKEIEDQTKKNIP
jgi:hypothetical protein